MTIDPTLVWSTYVGSAGGDAYGRVRLTPDGTVILAGASNSQSFPLTPGVFDTTFNGGDSDIVVSALQPDGKTLAFSTFIGGSSSDGLVELALGPSGSIFLAITTTSSDFPTTPGAFQTSFTGNQATAIVRLRGDGSTLDFSTFLDSSCKEVAHGLAVDTSGSAVVCGTTCSNDFPTTAGAFDTTPDLVYNSFVTKFDPTGSALMFSTFLDGTAVLEFDTPSGVAFDTDGSVVVAGNARSPDFPITPGAFLTSFGSVFVQGYVSRLSADGSTLLYSTFFGGSTSDTSLSGVIVEGNGSVLVAGTTNATDIPQTQATWEPDLSGKFFFARLSPDLSSLEAATAYGHMLFGDFTLGPDGGVTIVGTPQGFPPFPITANAIDEVSTTGKIFIGRFDQSLEHLLYSTYFGGSAVPLSTFGTGVAVDASNDLIVTGETGSPDWPTTPGAFDPSFNGGGWDAFVSKIHILYPWTTLGGGLAGTSGVPALAGHGNPCPGTIVKLGLTKAKTQALTTLVLGLDAVNLPLKGGVLVPAPDIVVGGLFTDTHGKLVLTNVWPAGVPSGFSIWMQEWIADPAGPKGFAASNAIKLTTE